MKEEKELIKKAQKDPEIFSQLYDRYYPQIFGYVLKRVANLEVAQDITSETFFKALRKLWQFRWQNISFSAWLYRIANNEIANYSREAIERMKEESSAAMEKAKKIIEKEKGISIQAIRIKESLDQNFVLQKMRYIFDTPQMLN